ncbi:Homeodomain-like protein [Pilaira anomala]|nr:Homeodomain-like protein [Pilaira anomala]
MYLPQRSPRRISNEWTCVSKIKSGSWTEKEDELLKKGYEQFGPSWTQIGKHYLPWRTRVQIRTHYRAKLDPDVKREKWTEDELDLLLRRTIMFGQDWKKVAEGLPGRTPEKCSVIWKNELDPGLNKGPWSLEETRLFWERLSACQGDFVKVSEGLPGRNPYSCFKMFWSMVRQDKEFELMYGDVLEKREDENSPEWRTRVARAVCGWLDQGTSVRKTVNHSITFHQSGPWDEDELLKLSKLVQGKLESKEKLKYNDWKEIAKAFPTRDVPQCKYQYDEHLAVQGVKKGIWSPEEDAQLVASVKEYGTDRWDRITEHLSHRTKRQCAYRWHRVLKLMEENPPVIKNKRLTDTEKSLIKEGVQMFGPNWTAIRMTFLPSRRPDQLMRWWHFQSKNGMNEEDGEVNHISFWSEDEDKALTFAVSRNQDEEGKIKSWAKVAKMIQNRTPKQCRERWLYSLQTGVTKGHWSYEEEMQLLELVQKTKLQNEKASNGSVWPLIAKELNTGRTDLACRAKYNYMQRKGHRFAFFLIDFHSGFFTTVSGRCDFYKTRVRDRNSRDFGSRSIKQISV